MSRIGKLPITIPAGVTVTVGDDNLVTVKGPKGTLTQQVNSAITLKQEGNILTLERPTDSKPHKAMHGLYRALIANMVHGVSEMFETRQEFIGVGFKVTVQGQIIEMSLGYSHDVQFKVPAEIKAEAPEVKKGQNPVLILKSCDKQLLGQVAAKVRSLRKPEPYKGKGIRFVGEQIRRKAGKSASAK